MNTHVTIVGFGNSITEASTLMPQENKRWLNVLQAKLAAAFPNYDFAVVNSGVGGNSSREAMARFQIDVLAHDPDWVLLEFGGNNDDPDQPARRVTVEEFKQHLHRFKSGLAARTKVAVITFPPVIDQQHSSRGSQWCKQFGGMDAAVERFRVMTRAFAAENGFPLVDLCRELKRKMAGAKADDYILPDGVHLTESGNRALAEMTFAVLGKEFRCG